MATREPEAGKTLQQLNIKALKKLAKEHGFSAEVVEDCDDALDTKVALIDLISGKVEAEADRAEEERLAKVDQERLAADTAAEDQKLAAEVDEEKLEDNDSAEAKTSDPEDAPRDEEIQGDKLRFYTATDSPTNATRASPSDVEPTDGEAPSCREFERVVTYEDVKSQSPSLMSWMDQCAKECGFLDIEAARKHPSCELPQVITAQGLVLDQSRPPLESEFPAVCKLRLHCADAEKAGSTVLSDESNAEIAPDVEELDPRSDEPSSNEKNSKAKVTFCDEGDGAKLDDATVVKSTPRKDTDSAVYLAAVIRLNDQLGRNPSIRKLSDHTRVPPLGVASIVALCVLCYAIYGLFGQFVSTLCGIVYPAYKSFKAVEDFSNLADPQDLYAKASCMQFWLMYWIVLALITICEYFFSPVLAWIPFYQPCKLTVLFWLYLPRTKGANFMYRWFVAPTLRRNQHKIDGALEQSGKHLNDGVKNAFGGVVSTSFDGVMALKQGALEVGFAAVKRFA